MDKQPQSKRARIFKIIRRVLLILLSIVFVTVVGVIIFLGDIAEYYIEKNDVKYTGREVELADLRVKVFSGVISLDNLQFKEANAVDDFISIKGVYARMKPWDLLSKQLTIYEVGLDRMITNISHEYRVFNFDDLITRFYPQDTTNTIIETQDSTTIDWDWNIANIHVDSCRFNYENLVLDSRITVDPFNLSIPLISSFVDTFSAQSDLSFLNGGSIASHAKVDLSEGDYLVDINWDRVPFDYLYKYLNDYLDISDFGGYISVDLHADGDLRNYTDVVVDGEIAAHEFRILDNSNDTLVAFQHFEIDIKEANYKDDVYLFGDVVMNEPYLRFELYPDGDNFTSILKFETSSDSTSIENISLPGREYFNVFIYLADYASYIVNQYEASSYRFDSIAIVNGTIHYIDYTLDQQAQFLLENIHLGADAFDSDQQMVTFDLESDINKVAHFDATWSFDPHDVLEMDLEMTTTDFLVVFVSPYSFSYTAHAFVDGKALYEGNVQIRDRQIESNNVIFIEDIEVGKKGFADPPIKLPVRLAVAILRDVNGDIEIELPVSGDLDDPKFNYWPAILQVLENNLEKIVTAPYRLFANMFSVDQEDLERIQWTYGQFEIEKPQRKSMTSLAKVLGQKPELAIKYTPLQNQARERDYLATFESKRRYYCQEILNGKNCALTAKDTVEIAKINNQDSMFVQFLKQRQPDSISLELISVQELAIQFIGSEIVDSTVNARIATRDSLFRLQMRSQHGIGTDRLIKWHTDSLAVPPDTLNLIGPKYLIEFDLYEPADSITTKVDTIDQ